MTKFREPAIAEVKKAMKFPEPGVGRSGLDSAFIAIEIAVHQCEKKLALLDALRDTTECLGSLLATILVHYPDYRDNVLVEANITVSGKRLSLSNAVIADAEREGL